jgi:hypothetical protein
MYLALATIIAMIAITNIAVTVAVLNFGTV